MTIACDFLTSRQFPFLFFLGNMGSSFFVGRQKERSDNRRNQQPRFRCFTQEAVLN